MTDHVAPQEDQIQLPAAWAARLLPWRGRRTGKPFTPADPATFTAQRQKIAARHEKIQAALALPGNEGYAADAQAYLDGEPNPRGAAAVAALILDYQGRSRDSFLRPEFDRWLHEHGLPFATAAAVERLAICPTTSGHYGGEAIAKRTIFEHDVAHPDTAVHELHHGDLAAVRSLLASVSDEAYAEVVAAVAGHRDSGAKRSAAMVLLPTETDWVLEACIEFSKNRAYAGQADLLFWHSASDPVHPRAAGMPTLLSYYRMEIDVMAAALGGLGTDALPVMLETDKAAHHYNDDFRKLLYRAIAMVPSDEATAFIFARLTWPNVWEAATEAASRYPVRALRTAARLAPDASDDLRTWLTAIAGMIAPAHRAHLDDADRAALADLLDTSGRVPDAAPEDLPPLLVAPPWTRKRPKVKPVVIEGLEAPAAAHLTWEPGEREAWSRVTGMYEPDEEYWHDIKTIELDHWLLVSFLGHGRAEHAEKLLDHWDPDVLPGSQIQLQRVLARFGERVIDRVLVLPATEHTCLELPGPILNQAAARIAAERLARLKGARSSAVRWFGRHGLAAVPYLVPDALGADKKRREYAATALALLATRHGRDAVAAEAEAFGPEAAQAVTALLDIDPLDSPVKVSKPGSWASPAILPQVLLKGGERALPAESVVHLLTVLALGTPDYEYRGVDVVAEACDRASLTRFSRAVFDRWLTVGAPSKDSWAFTQLMHFADDATVWDLAPRIREWPGQSQHKRAVTGLEVLGAIGSETALRAIQTIAEKVKFKALKEEAGRQITRIAEGLGLSREQLADRLVPDFGLGEAAALVLDYGPRQFTVAFDEQLKPFVRDGDGKPRKALPKPGAKDDPEIAAESYQRFSALKKELRSVAADQVRRFEAAMVSGRDWSVDEFRRHFVEHPLTGHLTRRLVWLADTGGSRFGFRIAEDGTFSDIEDDTVDLDATARIRLAHPVHLGAETAAWAEVLADYEVLQPFEQLGRPVLAFHDDELATGGLKRFEGAKVDVGRVLGLTQRGWNRASPEDGGVAPGIAYPLPGGGSVVVSLDPGIWIGDVGEAPEQTIVSARLERDERYRWTATDTPAREVPQGIDPVIASEVLAALTRLTGAA
ncbi:DUF4132 domain-containing protein [Glycomyces algeriensis]|uniref:DUF4132 domain-containing protein n=1 Tax=Glycomyces algeriensis TaxID=256037 RepID=A0A9W6LI56_9ACTN|nr:DUF4132 domain-containing protein [Glycomyces algeriensis]MDA1365854.1 DUF4132 domain-containing protein [Glycomyces algeriensis]MDR7351543.1 hypothetical protein [Glycomyces algeriensis]GLI44263.1 hypothetical protein GALLR39Z86_41130 [Glycomyces algeriensis]